MLEFEVVLDVSSETFVQDPVDGDMIHSDIEDWCREFVQGGWTWAARMNRGTYQIGFRFECLEDAVGFKMRWL